MAGVTEDEVRREEGRVKVREGELSRAGSSSRGSATCLGLGRTGDSWGAAKILLMRIRDKAQNLPAQKWHFSSEFAHFILRI